MVSSRKRQFMQSRMDKKLFTVEELHRMEDAGLFQDERVELVNGEILLMPTGSRHQARVDRLTALFTRSLGGRVIARIQGPLLVDHYNLPEPDVMLLKLRGDYYEEKHPGSADVLLLIEVVDSALERDLEVKLAVYAISGIQEYWIENVHQDVVLVFRDPSGDAYRDCRTLHRGETISPAAFPEFTITIEEILGS